MVTRGKFTPKARRRAMRQVLVASGRGAIGRGPVCNRDNITINRDGRLRVHGSQQGWPPSNCDGSGRKPKEMGAA